MKGTHEQNGHDRDRGKTPARAALASWVGSVLEYYDFFIYGTAAALVFGQVFFPESDPATGTLLSFATYGVGYVARPIGAFFMGHIGDKYGRKRVLLLTVTLMGVATFLVGCLPTYDHIGIWAPVLLVALRLLQGFSASGEQSGANSLSLEHAPEHRRAFFTSFTLSGTQTGPDHRHRRVPADRRDARGAAPELGLAHPVLAERRGGRRRPPHPPAARGAARVPRGGGQARRRAGPRRRAVARPLARRPARGAGRHRLDREHDLRRLRPQLRRRHQGLDQTTMLWVAIVTNVVALAAIPLWATLADRIGRKPVFIFGAVGSGALMFAYLGAIAGGAYPLIFLAAILMSGVVYSAMNGIQPSLYGEMFPTRVRLSGMAIGTQIGFAIGGFAPTAARAIAGDGPDGWVPVAVYVLVSSLIAAIAVATARETYKVPLAVIDGRTERASAPGAPAQREPVGVS